jgi:anti-sigma regulatory factor (Ser/Thr protein kinase)
VVLHGESYDFGHEPSSPAAARRFVRELLVSWGLAELTEVVELLVSEVVTNVIRHARTDGTIVVARSENGVRVAVSDSAGGEPTPLSPEPRQPSGRGLSIVDSMASRWGVAASPEGAGKSVWFEVDLTADTETRATSDTIDR